VKVRLRPLGWKAVALGAAIAAIAAVPVLAATLGDAKSENWGVINRNTIGSPVAMLRDGPAVMTATGVSRPPLGKGSLEIEVGSGTEKVAFGNEVDFYGDPVAGISAVGYYVLQTGEDVGYGGTGNLPNITLEIDPNVAGKHYTSMVWVPGPSAVSTVNQWSPYVDATTTGYWYFTNGDVATATGCGESNTCTLAQAQAALAAHGPGATILSVAISKGRDSQFQGAVDGLRLNDRMYDFEAGGVKAKPVK
jgi:hypothetical protein